MDFTTLSWPVTDFLSLLTLISHGVTIALILALVADACGVRGIRPIETWVSKHGIILMLTVACTAVAGSLFFSEVVGWAPCKDCWLQRIFMYPQVVLLGIALWKRDRSIARYILALCLLGACIAAYHYYIQMQDIIAGPNNAATPCDASGISCVKTPFVQYGYITIPLMSFTAFFLNGLGSLCMLRASGRTKR